MNSRLVKDDCRFFELRLSLVIYHSNSPLTFYFNLLCLIRIDLKFLIFQNLLQNAISITLNYRIPVSLYIRNLILSLRPVVHKSILNPIDQKMNFVFLVLVLLELIAPNSALETARPSYRRVSPRRLKRIATRRVHRMAMILKRKSLI